MSYGQLAQINVETSRYPKSRLFKPEKTSETSLNKIAARFFTILEVVAPVTEEERAYAARTRFPISRRIHASFGAYEDTDHWHQEGPIWIRHAPSGQHAQCRTTERQNASAWWRDPRGSYSCDGVPTFYPKTMQRFLKETELVKPVLYSTHYGFLLSLERTVGGPTGTCWGMMNTGTFYRVTKDGRSETVPATKAALKRLLTASYSYQPMKQTGIK